MEKIYELNDYVDNILLVNTNYEDKLVKIQKIVHETIPRETMQGALKLLISSEPITYRNIGEQPKTMSAKDRIRHLRNFLNKKMPQYKILDC